MAVLQSRPKTDSQHNQDFSDIVVMSGQQTQLHIEIVSDFKLTYLVFLYDFSLIFVRYIYPVRDVKSPNNQFCFPQFFPRFFLSFSSWKRKQTFYWFKTGIFSVLDQWKDCFLFQLLKLRKIRRKNWGKQDWWFDVTNKIL